MKNLVCGMALLILLGLAQPATAEEISGSFSTKFAPEYILNNGAKAYDGWVDQSELCFSLPHGYYAGVWGSMALERGDKFRGPMGDEIRYNVGWKETIGKRVYADIGAYYHDLNKGLGKGGGLGFSRDDLFKIYGEVGIKINPGENQSLILSARLEQLLPVGRISPERGAWFFLGLSHNWRMTSKLSLCQQLRVMRDDGALKKDAAFMGRYKGGVDIEIYKSMTVNFGVIIDAPLSHVSDGRQTEIVPTYGVTYKF